METIHHIAIGCSDVASVAAFYQKFLGLSLVRENHLDDGSLRSIWLRAGTAVLMLEATTKTRPKDAGVDDGVFLIAFSCTESEKRELRLRGQELEIIDRETEYTVYFRDPENNRFAVSAYDFS